MTMKVRSKKTAILLNAFAMPGMGQLYLGQKGRATLWMVLTLIFVGGGLIRYMSVLFQLIAIQHPVGRTPSLNPFPLMKEAWSSDQRVLLTFLLGLFLVWLLAILDLICQGKSPRPHEHPQTPSSP